MVGCAIALLAVPGCELATDALPANPASPASDDASPPVEPTLGPGLTIAQQAVLKASNTGPGDRFGWSVALDGDLLAVGASLESSSGRGVDGEQQDDASPGSGAVYVFRRNGDQWQQEAYLKASNTGARDRFGWSVALDGDLLAVGAIWEDGGAIGVNGHQHNDRALDSGAVYVFRRMGERGQHSGRAGVVWQQEAYLKASNTGAGDHFGYSLALSGDTLAVGAYREDSAATGVDGDVHDDQAPDSGAVYVFRRISERGEHSEPARARWKQEAYLKASNTSALDELGRSVALDRDTLAAGAIYEDGASPHPLTRFPGTFTGPDDHGAPNSGAVYVFHRRGDQWQQEAYLKALGGSAGDWFGRSLAIEGNTLVASALLEDSAATGTAGNPHDNSAPDSGAVYVFRRRGDQWQQEAYLKASNTHRDARFGMSVALDGGLLGVGAVFEAGRSDPGAGTSAGAGHVRMPGSGAVYLFSQTQGMWQEEAYLKASNAGAGDELGYSLALSQGIVAVGAIYEDSGGAGFQPGLSHGRHDDRITDSGAVYLFW